jgi:hypothetical protein
MYFRLGYFINVFEMEKLSKKINYNNPYKLFMLFVRMTFNWDDLPWRYKLAEVFGASGTIGYGLYEIFNRAPMDNLAPIAVECMLAGYFLGTTIDLLHELGKGGKKSNLEKSVKDINKNY